jgi:hypothetical protein
MSTIILEGTFEDILKQADRLAGKRLRVEVLSGGYVQNAPNQKALNVIRQVIDKQKNMRETGGKTGVEIIRRGRAGEMFGYEPAD